MILVFDLDDTLYDERTYVESGLHAVAAMGADVYGLDAGASFRFMVRVLDDEGRGAIFDKWLSAHGAHGKTRVQACVRVYRHHTPRLALNDDAKVLLPKLTDYPLYLVTDGHKLVQHRKIEALGIAPLFRKVFITHRYGIRHAKPSTYCFERILEREKTGWESLTYVGDNPAKDFVNLNRAGAHTVRVLTGVHKDSIAADGHEAKRRIAHLGELAALLPGLRT
jgi:putative hydrolase of the HAD superfamily